MIYVAYALRKTKREPIIDAKTKAVIDDGKNVRIQLWSGPDKSLIENFAENVKRNVEPRDWKIWVEKSS